MKTYDVRVKEFIPLVAPAALKAELPLSDASAQAVVEGRQAIQNIIDKKDPRMLVVTGPCSIHDEKAALEYAQRLRELSREVQDTMLMVMRVYFEKPRTTVGWKGLINDPGLDGSCDMSQGLRRARSLLMQITEMGLPTATELLDPITPQYIAGLVCDSVVRAPMAVQQTRPEMASGLSMPVGFKNCTDGSLNNAINAMIAAGSPQSFLGIDPQGQTSVVTTTGNPYAHIVLRGGGGRPNYDSVSIREAVDLLQAKGLPEAIVVDCSHENSRKQFNEQPVAWRDAVKQRLSGTDAIVGMMLESHLEEGRQENSGDHGRLYFLGHHLRTNSLDPCPTQEGVILKRGRRRL